MSGLPFVLFVCCTELCLAAILGAGVLPLAGVIVGSCARRIGVGRGAKRGATSGAGLAAALVMGQWLQSVWSPGGPNKYLSGYEWRRLATQELPGVGRITTHEIYLAADRRHWNSMTGAHRPLLANQLVPFGLSLPPAEPGTKRWVVLVSWGGLEEHPEAARSYPGTISSEQRVVDATFFDCYTFRPYGMAFGYHCQLPADERPLELTVRPPGLRAIAFDLAVDPPAPHWPRRRMKNR